MAVTRFAPSPTGLLHAGHAFSAWYAWEAAGRNPAQFVLRIEDIDSTRCRDQFVSALVQDLTWLGIQWRLPVLRQSARSAEYAAALGLLKAMGVLYPCFCTRQEIAAALSAPHGPSGPVYPGTCRSLTDAQREDRMATGLPWALRMDVSQAMARAGNLQWHDRQRGWQRATPEICGDVVLARKEVPVSYHLAVTVDDAAQGIERVTRGEDLFESTHMHRLLQALLNLPVPEWDHHRLITDPRGRRLAKRDDALSLASLREAGWTPDQVRELWIPSGS